MPVSSNRAVRRALQDQQPQDNPGLLFRCAMAEIPVKGQTEGNDLKKAHFTAVARARGSDDYRFYFEQLWLPMTQTAAQPGEATRVLRFKTTKRLITGLTESSVTENGFAFDRIYGVPILRGSGWKGMARRTAWHRLGQNDAGWAKGGALDLHLFGGTDAEENDEKGAVDFGDALPQPGKWKFTVDVLTKHGEKLWDSTTPINFLSLEDSEFVLPLRGPADWVERAAEIVTEAVQTAGFGAKTSSGYGRLQLA